MAKPSHLHLLTAGLLATTLLGACTPLAKMGVAPGVAEPGNRTTALALTDISLAQAIRRDIYRDIPAASEGNIDVNVFYENVLLVGEVPSAEIKQQVEQITRGYRDVRKVYNQLNVGLNRGLIDRAADSLLERKADFTLATADKLPSHQTYVVVHDGSVYLMGALTQAQTDRAIVRLQALDGVKRIIKALDIIAERPAE